MITQVGGPFVPDSQSGFYKPSFEKPNFIFTIQKITKRAQELFTSRILLKSFSRSFDCECITIITLHDSLRLIDFGIIFLGFMIESKNWVFYLC